VFSLIVKDKMFACSVLHLYLLLFVAKKHKEETSYDEVKSGNFVFSNGDRYGICSVNTTVFDIISERELTFSFAIYCRPSICRLSVCRLSVTFVRPTQAFQTFRSVSTVLGTLAIH